MACVPFLHFSTSSLHRVVLSSDPRHSASVGHSVPSKHNSANQGLLRIFTLTVLGFMGELPLDYYHSQIGRLSWIYNILIIRLIMCSYLSISTVVRILGQMCSFYMWNTCRNFRLWKSANYSNIYINYKTKDMKIFHIDKWPLEKFNK